MKRQGFAKRSIAGCAASLGLGLAALVPFAGAGAAGDGVTPVEVGDDFQSPVFVTHAPGFPNLLFVVEKGGTVEIVKNGTQRPRPFLDISNQISTTGEQGLLSIAFPADYKRSRLFYVYFTNRSCDPGTGGCDIEVAEYKRRAKRPYRARANSRRTVIDIRHRDATNHNGGTVMFGPGGKMWIATGDGGGSGDTFDNARDKTSLLGKLLRINPKAPPRRPRRGHRIPRSNPFFGEPGRDQIWSIGLRNPFRFSFDSGNIAIGDVGQGAKEEIDIVPIADAKGADFGWPQREGDQDYPGDRPGSGPLIEPIYAYPRPVTPADSTLRGVSVAGGIFVRDERLAGSELDPGSPTYIFGETFTAPPIRSLSPDVDAQTYTSLTGHPLAVPQPVGFGEDSEGRVHVASLVGKVYRLDPVAP